MRRVVALELPPCCRRRLARGRARLVLGPDDEEVKRFKVEGNRRVAGDGTVRVGPEWKDLTSDCVVDPEKAVATSFTYKMKWPR